jgi:hypothetical protein
VKVIQDELFLCADCSMVACNGSHGVELEDTDATLRGLAELGPHLVPDFDPETGEGLREFSSVPCASCKTGLAGYRARFAILGE